LNRASFVSDNHRATLAALMVAVVTERVERNFPELAGGQTESRGFDLVRIGKENAKTVGMQVIRQPSAHAEGNQSLTIAKSAQNARMGMTVPAALLAGGLVGVVMLGERVWAVLDFGGLAFGQIVDGKAAAAPGVRRDMSFVIRRNGNARDRHEVSCV
jgi:hypothetical protein